MRVTAGRLRGRKLVAPREARPTSERARSGLFDWLGARVEGRAVLDLFAGSGALGIEALSRGAARALFVEQSRPAVRTLRRNLDELALEGEAEVLRQDAVRALGALARRGERFGLVFADPPWGSGWPARLAKVPELVEILEPGGCLIFERSKRDTHAGIAGLEAAGTRVYGETAFDAYEMSGEFPVMDEEGGGRE